MIKIDIYSGFLGAGKTTLIKKMVSEAYKEEKVVLIENEFGEIGIDGGFLKDSGINVNEINSGCICCTLVGDFTKALNQVIEEFNPGRIIIEPSGVGKLSDIIAAVKSTDSDEVEVNGTVTVVDCNKCKLYMKNFGEFFNNQIENANAVILSHRDNTSEEKLSDSISIIRRLNKSANIISTKWDDLSGEQILEAMETKNIMEEEMDAMEKEIHDEYHHHEHHCHDHGEECGHHGHNHHEHGEECGHHGHHHHEHGEECGHHGHHHHEHGEECGHHGHHHHGCCGHHHHDHGEECGHHGHHHHDHGEECGHHGHHHHGCCGHHHDHHADEVFESIGMETGNRFDKETLASILSKLEDDKTYGTVLRCKGIVEGNGDNWLHFDYIPGEFDVREGSASTIGRICIIGTDLKKDDINNLFGF